MTKFAIGCLVQWYEIEILSEYIDTLKAAIDAYDKHQVLVDVKLVINQELEQLDNPHRLTHILSQFDRQMERLEDYQTDFFIDKGLTTIADYRREFNSKYCELADVLVWGESDMLVPRQAFQSLDRLHQAQSNQTPKYLATFAICKMWDDSWKPLEHVDFTHKNHSDSRDDWWGVNYTMTQEEMNSYNDRVEDLQVTTISPHKFNGCGLVISSEVIKAGVNIPRSVFFIHEDTAFMLMTQKILGNIPQYHFQNILVVHNRKRMDKRMYIKGESGDSIGQLRKSNKWYVTANKMCEQNCYNVLNPNYKSYTWNDVWQAL